MRATMGWDGGFLARSLEDDNQSIVESCDACHVMAAKVAKSVAKLNRKARFEEFDKLDDRLIL